LGLLNYQLTFFVEPHNWNQAGAVLRLPGNDSLSAFNVPVNKSVSRPTSILNPHAWAPAATTFCQRNAAGDVASAAHLATPDVDAPHQTCHFSAPAGAYKLKTPGVHIS
jgi:hypothetical protein